jgi:pilus assembly protein CpaB
VKIRLISTLVALVLAVVGSVLIFSYVRGADQRAYGEAEMVDVLVVTALIPAGTATEDLANSLEIKTVPKAAVADDVITNLNQFGGRVASVDLVVGETLIASRLVDPQSLGAPGTVPAPEGLQEFTVAFPPEQAVGGRISAGDSVGIFATFSDIDESEPNVEPATRHVFHRVLVTSVQGVTAPAEGAADAVALPAGSVYVTFATTAADAERIIFATQFSRLWLSLETEDDTDEGITYVTGENLVP